MTDKPIVYTNLKSVEEHEALAAGLKGRSDSTRPPDPDKTTSGLTSKQIRMFRMFRDQAREQAKVDDPPK